VNKINWCHAIGQAEDLDRTTKAVAWAIGAHMNAAGEANPSQPRLAGYASCSVSTVHRCVQRLEGLGFLDVTKNDGRRSSYQASTAVIQMTADPYHPDDMGTPVRSTNGFRKTHVTQMTAEIHKSQSNGTASTEDEAIGRWLDARGSEVTDSQAVAYIAQQWSVPRIQARLLVNANKASAVEGRQVA
jgi:DNA-binding transcriptional MocR family regulator